MTARRERELGLLTATCLVVANMVGSGVFTTSGFLLADLESPWVVLAAWLVGGIQAALGALCYGALARRIPESGGEYIFLSRTLHPAAGYLAGWISLLVGFSAPLAAAAFAFGRYIQPWLPGLAPAWHGSIVIVGFAVVHALHVRRGAHVQNWAVVLKVFFIGAFVFYGASRMALPEAAASVRFSVPAFSVSLVWISFSYSGWNAAVYIGGEIRDPGRNLPRSLLLGTALVTLLYLSLNTVFVLGAPQSELAGQLEVGLITGRALGGPALERLVSLLVSLVLVSSVSSLVMAGPRVYAQMAADGYLPRVLAVADGPPRAAIGLQAALALVLLWSAEFESLLTYIGFTLQLCTAATVLGLVRLRGREGRAMAVPGWPWVPGMFLLSVLGIAAFTIARRPWESLAVSGVLVTGALAWRVSRRRRPGAGPGPA
jgi:APA family basic amino acid/polyamine antiporter